MTDEQASFTALSMREVTITGSPSKQSLGPTCGNTDGPRIGLRRDMQANGDEQDIENVGNVLISTTDTTLREQTLHSSHERQGL